MHLFTQSRTRALLFVLLSAFTLTSLSSWAQNYDKMSAGTQMFLLMRTDEAKNGPQKAPANNVRFTVRPEVEHGIKAGFAPTEVVGGVEMIDAFIYLKDVNNVSSLESLGVEVMCKFDGFVTAKVPVAQINNVSELEDVLNIDVSRLVQPKTDLASKATNTDKAWDGLNNGLCDEYTGKGVLVGVIDQGIHFKHAAFNDNNGNSRVKRVYAPGRQSSVYTSNFPDYDVANGSHGTHTSTTAGGRAITLNGTTYSGMAPESDLFLCGLSSLSSTNIANSLSRINEYATSQGQPCVVNISLGSQYGAHDGTGSLASAYSSFTNHGAATGRVLCVAAGNEAGGNMYFGGTATSSSPACTSLEYCLYSDVDGTYTYYYNSSNSSEYFVWPRTTGSTLRFQFVVVDKRTKSVVYTTDAVTPGSSGSTVSLGSSYFSNGSVTITRGTDNYSGKYYYDITVRGTTTEDINSMTTNSEGQYVSRYAVGMLVYSATNSSVQFDCWGDGFSEFLDASYVGNYGNYTFTKGSDECSIGNEVPTSGIISVGAYVTRKTVTTTNNVSFTSSEYTVGDIAPFSSYSTGCGPDGQAYPDITAPGAVLIAGVNKYDTNNYPSSQTSSGEYMTIGNYSDGSRYGSMSGTSMATPTTTGIMALWLQANPNLTVNEIKQVFSRTAIRDSYVTGNNSARFGKYGKLDALEGLKDIAPCQDVPKITATPSSLDFGEITAGTSTTKTFTVTGENLEGNISLSLNGASFAISQTSVTKNTAEGNGATITVTFTAPANVSNTYTGTITLTSSNASNVTVSLTGKGKYTAPALSATPTSVSFTNCYTSQTYTKTVNVTGTNLQGNITAAINGTNAAMFSVSPTTLSGNGTVTITYTPTAAGSHSANLVLTTSGTGANTVTVPITGTAIGATIAAEPTSISFGTVNVGETPTQTFTVTGARLEGNIMLAKSGSNNFSIDKTSIAKNNDGTASATVTVTYTPTADATDNGTITLSSSGADNVTVSLTGSGHVLNPTINVNPDALTLATYVNEPTTQKFTVTGSDLSKDVYLALQNDAAGVFSLSQASIGANVANGNGREITVTFSPTTLGDYTATVRLTSTGAETKYVTLNASAVEHVPALTVTPQSINFGNVEPGGQATQTFTLNGEYLMGDVALTLNDASGVFSLSDATVTKADAEAGKTVTVSFSATEETSYTGSITVSTSGLQNITIALSAEVSSGGTASDAYLDIAKYATIDKAGWNTSLVNKLYTYKEYVNDNAAWLTLPLYGALVGAKYSTNSSTFNSGSPQKWIETNVTASNQCGSTTWSATDIYLGSSNYFTSTTSMAVGTNSQNSKTEKSVTFYVTNTTAVKLYASQRSTSTSYPTSFKIYECSINNDGSLNVNSTATKSGSLTNSGAGSISLTELDETKIYKIVASQARGYLYEIGFQTPLNKPTLSATPAEVSIRTTPNETGTATFNVKGKKLTSPVTVSLTDANGVFSVPTTTISAQEAMDGKDVTVSFTSADEGIFTGTVTLTSGDLTATVNLTGVCRDNGTASDNYLNIAKYATIDEAGATVTGMETIYKYTEHASDDCAWLTLSNYGAMKADENQNWLTSSSLSQYNNSWSASDVFPGQEAYFGSAQAYSVYGSGNQVFYVTNCTQVKAMVKDGGSSKATLAIYVCTENADGTITASATATDSQQGGASGTAVITSASLDASKIYMVRLTGGGSYPDILEIGFQTPLNTPTLVASPTGKDIIAEPGQTITETITVTGQRLTDDVTVTLTDPNGCYSVSPATISAADAMAGATVTVTFNAPEQMGSYRAQVNFISGTATARTVFYGAVGEKGSAYSNYLDIAKYATIGTGDWYDGVFDHPYKFDDETYAANNVAWLTLPAAMPYYAWNYNDQNWCGISSSASGGWYGHQWTATDVFQGYEYFKGTFEDETEDYAHMMGGAESNSTSNTTIFYGIYNVTNCTQVKAYAYNNTGVSSTYPAFIQIYELTENADGTLTQSDTRTDIQTSTTSGAVTMTSAELDANKIYLVAVGGYRGFTYEVAFRTPLPNPVTLAELASDGNEGQYYKLVDGDLEVVAISDDGKKLFCKDNNAYANPSEPGADEIDFVFNYGLMDGHTGWDQSNWVALQRVDGSEWTSNEVGLVGSTIKNVKGTYANTTNPVISMSSQPSLHATPSKPYMQNMNRYITCNFYGTQTGDDGKDYFFVAPKPMEVVEIHWAMWDADANCFVVPPRLYDATTGNASNWQNLKGGFYINDAEYPGTMPKLENENENEIETVYSFTALVKSEKASASAMKAPSRALEQVSGNYMVYPISTLKEEGYVQGGIITQVNDIHADGQAVEVGRYNAAGQRVGRDYRGVVIIRMSDGTARKVLVE